MIFLKFFGIRIKPAISPSIREAFRLSKSPSITLNRSSSSKFFINSEENSDLDWSFIPNKNGLGSLPEKENAPINISGKKKTK